MSLNAYSLSFPWEKNVVRLTDPLDTTINVHRYVKPPNQTKTKHEMHFVQNLLGFITVAHNVSKFMYLMTITDNEV